MTSETEGLLLAELSRLAKEIHNMRDEIAVIVNEQQRLGNIVGEMSIAISRLNTARNTPRPLDVTEV